VQAMAPASLPAPGSVRAKAARRGASSSRVSQNRFCSGLPAMSRGAVARVLAEMAVYIPAQPQAISSFTTTSSIWLWPGPPSAFGTAACRKPCSQAWLNMGMGHSAVVS